VNSSVPDIIHLPTFTSSVKHCRVTMLSFMHCSSLSQIFGPACHKLLVQPVTRKGYFNEMEVKMVNRVNSVALKSMKPTSTPKLLVGNDI